MGGPSGIFKRWRPQRADVLSSFDAPPYRRIRLDRFPRGIDNVRVDVALDPRLANAASTLVAVVLREDVQRYFWKQDVKAPNREVVDVFRNAYSELSQSVVGQARALAKPERVQLFQVAVFKLLLTLLDREVAKLRQELEDACAHPARQQSGYSLELHERAVILSRRAREIRFRTLKDVLGLVFRLEQTTLRKARKTILGISWPLAEPMLAAPALRLGGRGSPEDFIRFFPYFLYDDDKAAGFFRHLYETLGDWLPDDVELPQAEAGDTRKQDRSRGSIHEAPGLLETEQCAQRLIGEKERFNAVPHAFDDPVCLVELLGGEAEGWPSPGRMGDARWAKVFRQRYKLLRRQLAKAGLLKEIQASVLLRKIHPMLGLPDDVELVYPFLSGNLSRRELMKRLEGRSDVEDAAAMMARIEDAVRSYTQTTEAQQRSELLAAVRLAVEFRYQCKLAWWMLMAQEDVHLLFAAREIEMSRANGLLHEFFIGAEREVVAGNQQAGHVILKADLRGSTAITATMRARKLNPAAHFSRNFYDPVSALLADFGAEKVFVEGDAIILAVIERPGEPLAVARACGLAQRMLEVVERKNAECRRLDLPLLELGIGIAYSNESPTYLYDGGHKIMISPAINRADRLSSCDSRLRELLLAEGVERGVEVVNAVSERSGEVGEKLLPVRFNVNGVELEAAAFYQLGAGLKLNKLTLTGQVGLFHVGRYLDQRGNIQWLAVREAPVRRMFNQQLEPASETDKRRFHQVVTDPVLLEAIRKRLAGKR